ncbi:NUDIX domain-containing protein [Psychrobacter aquaticus]|uniref:8-oxo-dGTP diphosphatase n=1 Tax=Psychrobacter aquaticus CMS 56 TaxID=1354303 RepID=U4T8N2_9GAMM|nr:NUDIX domain-containing protein [Psychrobacter aquaticus]ERL55049.1 Mutator mutT protein (7,8-dihydro-8-oxoguanine-triphosphatase) [Psychrobacter aquaticus CMS 56]
MSDAANKSAKHEQAIIVNVAIAVIYHKEQYLLGFRHAAQHQGNRYEFVGGKIDTNESAEQAVIREVAEETGIAIQDNTMVKLGRLHHDYGDKQVSLAVYKIELTAAQYKQHKPCQHGLEGQALAWVDKGDLLAGKYHLPAANKTILTWLSLPTNIAITYPLAHFSAHPDPAAAWLQYHQETLAADTWIYIRIKDTGAKNLAAQLMDIRPDILAIVPEQDERQSLTTEDSTKMPDVNASEQIVANHLTHAALMQWFDGNFDSNKDAFASDQLLSHDRPLIVSCHDIASIRAANKLANLRLQQVLPPVIAAFLSPILATQTHPNTEPLGWESWSVLAQLADMPIIGLGGLSPAMIDQVLAHGGVSVAGIREFL